MEEFLPLVLGERPRIQMIEGTCSGRSFVLMSLISSCIPVTISSFLCSSHYDYGQLMDHLHSINSTRLSLVSHCSYTYQSPNQIWGLQFPHIQDKPNHLCITCTSYPRHQMSNSRDQSLYCFFRPLSCTSFETKAARNSLPASQSTQSGINTQRVLKKTK